MIDEQPLLDLSNAVKERRRELGYTQHDIFKFGGPSTSTVRNIEQCNRYNYTPRTINDLEKALEWDPGTVERILKRPWATTK